MLFVTLLDTTLFTTRFSRLYNGGIYYSLKVVLHAFYSVEQSRFLKSKTMAHFCLLFPTVLS